MHRLLERFDDLGSNVVIILYLLGLGLGTLSYFTGALSVVTAAFAGLALAVEMHSWLMQRRTFEAWGNLQAAKRSHLDDEVIAERFQSFRSVGLVFLLLLSFSAFCSVMYTEATWRPTDTALLPAEAQVIIRGLIVPVLFCFTAFLVPLHTDAAAMLAKSSHNMLDLTLRKMSRQWNRRVGSAVKRNLDLAPITIALLQDQGDVEGARRVQLLADGLDRAEGRAQALYVNTVDADKALPPIGARGQSGPVSTYLRNVKGNHDGYSEDSDPAVPAIVNGTNGTGGSRNGNGRYDSRAEAQRSQIHSLSQTAALSSGANDPRASLVLVPPASSAATAEWLSFEDDAPTPELYAPFSQPVQPDRSATRTAAKRQQAARDRKAAGKQRKAWAQDAAAKSDPMTHPASSGSRKRRSDADRPRAISDDVLERQIQTMVDLLIARESPDTHEVLHDYYTVAMRPMKRAAVKAIKRLYGTDETVNEMAVYRARDRWHSLMQDGKAPTGTVMDLEDLDGFEIPDETDLGAIEGYGTLGMVTDDFEYPPE